MALTIHEDHKIILCQWCKTTGVAEFKNKPAKQIQIKCLGCEQWLQPGEYEILYESNEKKQTEVADTDFYAGMEKIKTLSAELGKRNAKS